MYDIAQPYGPLVETSMRAITWNVWGRFGPWEQREKAIRATIDQHDADVVALVEAWSGPEERFRMPHHVFAGDVISNGAPSGMAVLSRWPITRRERVRLSGSGDCRRAGARRRTRGRSGGRARARTRLSDL